MHTRIDFLFGNLCLVFTAPETQCTTLSARHIQPTLLEVAWHKEECLTTISLIAITMLRRTHPKHHKDK